VPDTAAISLLSDKQLGRVLAHHKTVLQVPQDWWINPVTGKKTACTVMATACTKIAGAYYLDCQLIKPDAARKSGHILQLPVSAAKGKHTLHLRRLLNIRFNNPSTLSDLGLTTDPSASAVTAIMNVMAEVLVAQQLAALRTLTPEDGLDDITLLEPDPKSHRKAMKHPRLAPFWAEAAGEEMDGLWRRGCFKTWKLSELTREQRKHVFGSRFHHKLKRHTKTGKLKSCKIRLVVMGNNMEKGEDFTDSFAPVPRSTAGRILMSMAAAMNLPDGTKIQMSCTRSSDPFTGSLRRHARCTTPWVVKLCGIAQPAPSSCSKGNTSAASWRPTA